MAGSNGERRLNTWLGTGAHYALARAIVAKEA
ncbi:MAG: hypothetical protein JWP34_716 [Massilia sp.]|jgi:hypothetical protein|nr:hypothetical protein [Massilia sp.]